MKPITFWKILAIIGWILFFIVLYCWLWFPDLEAKEISSPTIWKVLLAEGANQGYEGMYAIACVIRNRGGDLNGFCGAKRKDLDDFCQRQGRKYQDMAKAIERIVFKENGKDVTYGATYFENTKAFGTPSWVNKMIIVYKIGSHTFYKEKINEKK